MTRNQYAGLIGVLLLFGLFGWPTLYAHRTMRGSPVRYNRLTGCMDADTPNGWERIPGSNGDCMTAKQKSDSDNEKIASYYRHLAYDSRKSMLIDKLRSDATARTVNSYTSNYEATILNNSECSISTLTIKVNGRTYMGHTSVFSAIEPHQIGTFEYNILHPEEFVGGKGSWDMTDISYSTPGKYDEDSSCVMK